MFSSVGVNTNNGLLLEETADDSTGKLLTLKFPSSKTDDTFIALEVGMDSGTTTAAAIATALTGY